MMPRILGISAASRKSASDDLFGADAARTSELREPEAAEAQQRAERGPRPRPSGSGAKRTSILGVLNAEESLEQLRAGARDEVSRLQFELAEAEDRAKRAEQWVARIRQDVEGALMRSSAAGRRAQYP